jgi:sulfur carrier protein ThiS
MHIIYRSKEWNVDQSMTVNQMLKRIRVLPESVLVVSNGKLVPEDHRLEVGDEVKVVDVISGG